MAVTHDFLAVEAQGYPRDFKSAHAGHICKDNFIITFIGDDFGNVDNELFTGRANFASFPFPDLNRLSRNAG